MRILNLEHNKNHSLLGLRPVFLVHLSELAVLLYLDVTGTNWFEADLAYRNSLQLLLLRA